MSSNSSHTAQEMLAAYQSGGVQGLLDYQPLAQAGDRFLSTERSDLAKEQRFSADLNGEPEYLSPAQADGRLLKTGPIAHKPLSVLSVLPNGIGKAAGLALVTEGYLMPGPAFGNPQQAEQTEGQKALGIEPQQVRSFAPRTRTGRRLNIFWSVLAALIVIGAMVFRAPEAFLLLLAVPALGWLFSEYYLRRTNRKEVMLVIATITGLLGIATGTIKAHRNSGINSSTYGDGSPSFERDENGFYRVH